MTEKNMSTALAYYQAMQRKDLVALENYLHPEVRLIGPLADITGKEAVMASVTHMVRLFKTLTVRAQFESGSQVMLAYDVEFPQPIGVSRAAVLLTFEDGLIKGYELFFDARPFTQR